MKNLTFILAMFFSLISFIGCQKSENEKNVEGMRIQKNERAYEYSLSYATVMNPLEEFDYACIGSNPYHLDYGHYDIGDPPIHFDPFPWDRAYFSILTEEMAVYTGIHWYKLEENEVRGHVVYHTMGFLQTPYAFGPVPFPWTSPSEENPASTEMVMFFVYNYESSQCPLQGNCYVDGVFAGSFDCVQDFEWGIGVEILSGSTATIEICGDDFNNGGNDVVNFDLEFRHYQGLEYHIEAEYIDQVASSCPKTKLYACQF